MSQISPKASSWLRWAHEFMFSLNLSWAVVWMERAGGKVLFGNVPMHWVNFLVGKVYQLATPFAGYGVWVQLVWPFISAAILFSLLRLLSRFAITNVALCTVAGAVAIAGFPFAALQQYPFGLIRSAYDNGAYHAGLMLEVIFVLICGTGFFLRKRPLSSPLMITILFLHFGAWAWVTSSYINIPEFISSLRASTYYHPWGRTLGSLGLAMIFNFGFPAFGLLASLTWVWYVRCPSEITD